MNKKTAMTNEEDQSTEAVDWRRRLRSIQAAAIAGIIAAIGWAIVLAKTLHDVPHVGATNDEITKYYAGVTGGLAGAPGIALLSLATIGFLWFIGVIRDRVGNQAPQLFGTVFLGSGIVFAGILFVGMAVLVTPAVLVIRTDRVVDPEMAAMTRVLASVLLGVIAPRMMAVFILSFSSLALRTGAMPKWVALLSYLVGLLMLLGVTFTTAPVYLFPAWVAFVSVMLLFRDPSQEAT